MHNRAAELGFFVDREYMDQKKTMRDMLADLVAFHTVSGEFEPSHQALQYIEDYLREKGLFIERFEQNGLESLIATTKRTKSPTIMLAAHLDVVPAPIQLFKLEERHERFYGRGTCDMKFAIAAYMQLVDDLGEDLHLYDFGIMITSDEEIGGRDGVQALLKHGYRARACVLPDGGDNWVLEQSAKGLLWIKARTDGATAHGSRPWEGENAIGKMLLFLQAMHRELFAGEQNDSTNTYNVGTIQGGDAVNQVADNCRVNIDIRPINQKEQDHILNKLRMLGEQYDVHLELYLNDPPINIDLTDPYVRAYTRSVEKATGEPLKTMRSNGGSDARYFAAYDIPTLVGYPTGGGRHGDDEWLEVASFYKFRDVLQDYLEQIARITDRHTEKSLTSAQ